MTNRAGCNRRAGTRLCENPCHQTQPSFFSLFLFFFSCLPMRKYSVPYALPEKKRSISCLTANIPADATLIMGASHFEVNEQDRRKVHEKRTPCLFLASAVKISYGFFPSASTSTGRVLSLPSVAGCLEGEEMWVWCHQLQGTTSSYRQS